MASLEDSIIFFFNFIGHSVCHQIPERTLWIGGNYLPVCARDTGAYLGLCMGYLLLPLRRKEACGPPNLWMTSLMVTPMIIDALTQVLGFRTSTNELRLVTGCLFGVALSPFLIYLISMVPLSRKLPIVGNFLPKSVRLDAKDSWLSSRSLSLGLLAAIVLSLAVDSTVGSANSSFYWLLSPLIIGSIIWHILLLPAFLAFSFFVNRKVIFNPSWTS
jgi:uncharacterized membrane protein